MDYTIGGKCPPNCGRCCTAMLPMNDHEIKRIKHYIQKKEIKAMGYNNQALNYVDKCPFLNEEGKCNIYIHRPEVCRFFSCAGSKDEFCHWDKRIVNLYEEFYPEIELPLDKPDAKYFDKAYQKRKKEVKDKLEAAKAQQEKGAKKVKKNKKKKKK